MLTSLIILIYWIYTYILIAYVVLSWLPQLKQSPLGMFLGRLSEPYLYLFRRIIPLFGYLDLSPLVALFTLFFAKEGLLFLLRLLS